ncbi:MAG: 3-oxoacyl-[acyl-carrier-protein] reductase [Sporolactobacillus sp.]
MTLKGQVALVTGASRGIGRAIAIELAEAGASIVVNYAGNRARAEETAAAIRALGQEAWVCQGDVSREEDVAAVCQGALDHFGHIDILINNAGITRDGLLMRMKAEDWDAVLNTNLKGVFLMTKAVLRPMMRQKKGRIINIASVVGIAGNAGQANYSAAKAGVIGLTKTTAREVASRGITVNAIAPGFIATDMSDKLSEEIKEKMKADIPLGRLGEPKDVAKAACFLASEAAAYITGQTLSVDGGMTMH